MRHKEAVQLFEVESEPQKGGVSEQEQSQVVSSDDPVAPVGLRRLEPQM